MARPIKETPILKNKDAVIFINSIKNPKRVKPSIEVVKRQKENYEKLNSLLIASRES